MTADRPNLWQASAAARELFAAAAVRERFLPADLLAQWTDRHGVENFDIDNQAMAAIEAALDLERLAEPALAADGSEAFVLAKPIRLNVLGTSDDHLLRQCLPQAEGATLVERALRAIFDDKATPSGASTRQELSAYITAVEWAQAAGLAQDVDLPDLHRDLAVQDFIETLAGRELSHFVGRERQLASLHKLWSLPPQDRPAILLEGPGGIGKSLLAAKFITEAIEAAPGECPDGVFVIDFERHEFRNARVSTIFREMIRQAARWWLPEAAALLEQRSETLDYGVLESVDSAARSSEAMQDDQMVAMQFAGYFHNRNATNPRFIVFADTFEEVAAFDDEAAGSVARACALLRQTGVDVLELYASRLNPDLPIWSRPPARLILGRLPQREAQAYLRREATALGIDLSRSHANAAQHKVGGWPLNLRLAVALMGDAASFDAEKWIGSLESSDKRIQATLYQRFLNRIGNKNVRKLAMPGLLLRRLTGPIVEEVLAKPCRLDLPLGGGGTIIAQARALGQLFAVDSSDPGAVWHRADLRALMFQDLHNAIEPEVRRDIHRRAARFYKASTPLIDRAEHLYHLLQLEESSKILDEHWTPDLGPRLKSALAELPEAGAAWLRTRLGAARATTPNAGAEPAVSRERLQELRLVARKRLQEGNADIDDLLDVASLPRSAVSDFGDLYVQSLIMQGRRPDALREAARLRNSRKRIPGAVRAGVYAAAATIHEGRNELDAAYRFWNAAVASARSMDPIDRINARVGKLRVMRRLGFSSQRTRAISDVSGQILDLHRELNERRVLAREALAEVAERVFTDRARSEIAIYLTDLCGMLLRRDEMFVWAKNDEKRRAEVFRALDFDVSPSRGRLQIELNEICSKMIYGGSTEFWGKFTKIIQEEVEWSIRTVS